MSKRLHVVLLFLLAATAPVFAQPVRTMDPVGGSMLFRGFHPHRPHFLFHSHFHRPVERWGFFTAEVHRGFRGFARHRAPLLHPGWVGGDPAWLWGYRMGPFRYARASGLRHGTADFVEYWSARPPDVFEGGLESSPVLSEGMAPDTVVTLLGSPTGRSRLGDVEMWTYSGYVLYFRSGRLVGIR